MGQELVSSEAITVFNLQLSGHFITIKVMVQSLTGVTPVSATAVLRQDRTEFPMSPSHNPGIPHPFLTSLDQKHSPYLKQQNNKQSYKVFFDSL